jgi:hypothetical protein
VLGALVQHNAAFGADFPEQALEQVRQLVQPSDGWPFEDALDCLIVLCVIQWVYPLFSDRCSAIAGERQERRTSRADIRFGG